MSNISAVAKDAQGSFDTYAIKGQAGNMACLVHFSFSAWMGMDWSSFSFESFKARVRHPSPNSDMRSLPVSLDPVPSLPSAYVFRPWRSESFSSHAAENTTAAWVSKAVVPLLVLRSERVWTVTKEFVISFQRVFCLKENKWKTIILRIPLFCDKPIFESQYQKNGALCFPAVCLAEAKGA